jgi:hypothetical protein
VGRCTTGSRGEVPGERKPVIRDDGGDDDDDDDDDDNGKGKLSLCFEYHAMKAYWGLEV